MDGLKNNCQNAKKGAAAPIANLKAIMPV